MKGQLNSDEAIIKAFKKGGEQSKEAMAHLFKDKLIFNRVLNYVLYNGGVRQDAIDVLVESLIILERNVRKGRFLSESSIATYLTGIAKLYWTQMKKTKGVQIMGNEYLAEHLPLEDTPENIYYTQELKDKLNYALSLVGEKCKKLLNLWSMNYSAEEISKILGLASSSAVRKQKFYCKEKLVDIVNNDPNLLSEFRNGRY